MMSLKDEDKAERIVEALLAILYPRVEVPPTIKANCIGAVLDALGDDPQVDDELKEILDENR